MADGITKQSAGFRYGVRPVTVLNERGRFTTGEGRQYRVLDVEADGHLYIAIRLYNAKGKFIKQLLMERVASMALAVWLA